MSGHHCGASLFGRLAPWDYESENGRVTEITDLEAVARDCWIYGGDVITLLGKMIRAGKLPEGYICWGEEIAH